MWGSSSLTRFKNYFKGRIFREKPVAAAAAGIWPLIPCQTDEEGEKEASFSFFFPQPEKGCLEKMGKRRRMSMALREREKFPTCRD